MNSHSSPISAVANYFRSLFQLIEIVIAILLKIYLVAIFRIQLFSFSYFILTGNLSEYILLSFLFFWNANNFLFGALIKCGPIPVASLLDIFNTLQNFVTFFVNLPFQLHKRIIECVLEHVHFTHSTKHAVLLLVIADTCCQR